MQKCHNVKPYKIVQYAQLSPNKLTDTPPISPLLLLIMNLIFVCMNVTNRISCGIVHVPP